MTLKRVTDAGYNCMTCFLFIHLYLTSKIPLRCSSSVETNHQSDHGDVEQIIIIFISMVFTPIISARVPVSQLVV